MNSTQQWQNVTWFEVDEHQAGQRIDNFLFSRLKGVPKSRIYRLMREGQVRVNKKRIKAETKLAIGDLVRVAPIRYEPKDDTPVPVSDKVAQSLLSRIVYEDEGLMVVNKPSGIAVHGGSGVAYGLIEGLRAASGKKYLELIHRIARDTSGLVMISKKRSTLKTLQDLLREHKIKKTYAAIVKGQVILDKQLIDAPLHRYELANGERRVCVSKEGKDSKTQWNVAERFRHGTLVYASPLSGRTHQIRVHFNYIGHGLVGDPVYVNRVRFPAGASEALTDMLRSFKRQALHAAKLGLVHPRTGQEMMFEAPWPEDFNKLLEVLRSENEAY